MIKSVRAEAKATSGRLSCGCPACQSASACWSTGTGTSDAAVRGRGDWRVHDNGAKEWGRHNIFAAISTRSSSSNQSVPVMHRRSPCSTVWLDSFDLVVHNTRSNKESFGSEVDAVPQFFMKHVAILILSIQQQFYGVKILLKPNLAWTPIFTIWHMILMVQSEILKILCAWEIYVPQVCKYLVWPCTQSLNFSKRSETFPFWVTEAKTFRANFCELYIQTDIPKALTSKW